LVERLLYTQDVGGSSPSPPTRLRCAATEPATAKLALASEAGLWVAQLRLGKPVFAAQQRRLPRHSASVRSRAGYRELRLGRPVFALPHRITLASFAFTVLSDIGGSMKCPDCNTELVQKKRDGVEMEICPSCNGMWLTSQEMTQLEDEVFDFGDDEKGSLMFEPTPTTRKCPQCAKLMKTFQYRLYDDLELDFCEDQHGFWLDADEDQRVLEIMKKEEKNLGRTVLAQDRFAAHLQYLRSGSLMDRIHDLVTAAMDPRTKPKF
jgi:Zn-finger nucleic acid-binding protein